MIGWRRPTCTLCSGPLPALALAPAPPTQGHTPPLQHTVLWTPARFCCWPQHHQHRDTPHLSRCTTSKTQLYRNALSVCLYTAMQPTRPAHSHVQLLSIRCLLGRGPLILPKKCLVTSLRASYIYYGYVTSYQGPPPRPLPILQLLSE